jgi:hypothetical protein
MSEKQQKERPPSQKVKHTYNYMLFNTSIKKQTQERKNPKLNGGVYAPLATVANFSSEIKILLFFSPAAAMAASLVGQTKLHVN